MFLLQATPVAASTLSFFLLSLDRYATVKHPRLAQLRQRRYLHVSLALISWMTSAIVSVPFLFIYKIVAKTVVIKNASHRPSSAPLPTPSPFSSADPVTASSPSLLPSATLFTILPPTPTTSSGEFPNVSISCHSDPGANPVFVIFILIHTLVVFILPGIGVLLNHYGVRRKLCALSLTARAAHGELPLPMPILRRQTHMVIVTGIANAHQAAGCGGTTDDTSNGGDIQMQNLNPRGAMSSRNIIKSKNPISPRAMREIREHSQRQRMQRAAARGRRVATPGIPLPQTSTLRSRRHLANMLIGSALVFIACWTPHVFCVIYRILGYNHYCNKSSRYFNLLLGYMYSALSPIIYWALNHNSLRQSPCAPLIRLRSMQKFLRTRFRSNPVPPAPSSTNEAQLGAFNPKLIKLTPKQYRAQASSHYLY
uniref:G-protein coupled receptors family 1 profile domain-containing protein n=1 Tax=Stomoxys calcitrans TaxID=35570 RepID=A0A1I8NXM7_STOCA